LNYFAFFCSGTARLPIILDYLENNMKKKKVLVDGRVLCDADTDTKDGRYAGRRHSEMLAFNSCDIVNLMKRGFEI